MAKQIISTPRTKILRESRRVALSALKSSELEKKEKETKIATDEAKKILDSSSPVNRNFLRIFYGILGPMLFLVIGISDEQLLLNNSQLSFTFVSLPVKVIVFSLVAPLLILVLHYFLLHSLSEHNKKLRSWSEMWERVQHSPDIRSIISRSGQLSPFFYDFAWIISTENSRNRNNMLNLCWCFYCWIPFSVLIVFFIRFADLQSYWYSSWHVFLIAVDCLWLQLYWKLFFRKDEVNSYWARLLNKITSLPRILLLFSALPAFWFIFILYEIFLFLDYGHSPVIIEKAIEWEIKVKKYADITIVPRLALVGYGANQNSSVSPKPACRDNLITDGGGEITSIINLNARNLGFANFDNAVLPCMDFRGAKLGLTKWTNAILSSNEDFDGAQLQGAIFRGAQLKGAKLKHAALQGADFRDSSLQGVSFENSNLQGSDLREAKLQGANLRMAKLQGAILNLAQLQGGHLESTQFQGADLSQAQIQGAVIHGAEFLGAKLPDDEQLKGTIGKPAWHSLTEKLAGIEWATRIDAGKETMNRIKAVARSTTNRGTKTFPQQDKEKFVKAWLDVVCTQEETAREMLRHNIFERKLPREISDSALEAWINNNPSCKSFHDFFKRATSRRANDLSSL